MTERQPTEHEWRLVAKVMGWEDFEVCSVNGRPAIMISETLGSFDPLHDHNDLARFVEALQAAGWFIQTNHVPPDGCFVTIFKENCFIPIRTEKDDALIATFWACVEALVAEEERDD